MTPESEHIVVGRITGAYGIKGWVKVFSYTDPMEGILQYAPWTLVRGGKRQTTSAQEGRRQGKALIARLEGVEDRNQAELMAGWEIEIDKALLPRLEDGELYWYQLEGLAVVNERGDRFGRIARLLETGSSDVLVVAADESSIDDQERMIPFVEEDIVTRVDLDSGTVTVKWEADY